jgi:O-antigen/teichoic acid export membrane protein
MGLAFIPFYIRFLGIEVYGLIGIFALLQSWLSLLDLGMTPALSREMARFTAGGHSAQSIRDLLRSVVVASMVIAIIVACGIWVGSGALATDWLRSKTLPVATVAHAFAIMGAVAAMRFIENAYRSALVGLQHQVKLNVVTAAAATLRGLGAIAVLAWVSASVHAYFIWQGIVSLATLLVLARLADGALPASERRARFSIDLLKSVRGFATGTLLVTLLGFVLSQSDKLILSSVLSLETFGIYSLAYSVASAIRLLTQPIDQAVYPRLTQLYHDGNEASLARLYHKSAQFSAVLMGGVGVFLAVFGQPVLAIWTQNPAVSRRVYSVLWILIVGMMLNGVMNGPYHLQMAAGWTALLAKVNAVMVVVFLPAIYLLTKRFGVTGAALSWVLLNLTYVVVVARLMHRRLLRGEMAAWYVNDLLTPFAAAVATAFVLRMVIPFDVGLLGAVCLLGACLICILTAASLASSIVRGELRARVNVLIRRYA